MGDNLIRILVAQKGRARHEQQLAGSIGLNGDRDDIDLSRSLEPNGLKVNDYGRRHGIMDGYRLESKVAFSMF